MTLRIRSILPCLALTLRPVRLTYILTGYGRSDSILIISSRYLLPWRLLSLGGILTIALGVVVHLC